MRLSIVFSHCKSSHVISKSVWDPKEFDTAFVPGSILGPFYFSRAGKTQTFYWDIDPCLQ